MTTRAKAKNRLLIGAALFLVGGVAAASAAIQVTADAVRADELGLSGVPNPLLVLVGVVGTVLLLSGIMIIAVSFAKWGLSRPLA